MMLNQHFNNELKYFRDESWSKCLNHKLKRQNLLLSIDSKSWFRIKWYFKWWFKSSTEKIKKRIVKRRNSFEKKKKRKSIFLKPEDKFKVKLMKKRG